MDLHLSYILASASPGLIKMSWSWRWSWVERSEQRLFSEKDYFSIKMKGTSCRPLATSTSRIGHQCVCAPWTLDPSRKWCTLWCQLYFIRRLHAAPYFHVTNNQTTLAASWIKHWVLFTISRHDWDLLCRVVQHIWLYHAAITGNIWTNYKTNLIYPERG